MCLICGRAGTCARVGALEETRMRKKVAKKRTTTTRTVTHWKQVVRVLRARCSSTLVLVDAILATLRCMSWSMAARRALSSTIVECIASTLCFSADVIDASSSFIRSCCRLSPCSIS